MSHSNRRCSFERGGADRLVDLGAAPGAAIVEGDSFHRFDRAEMRARMAEAQEQLRLTEGFDIGLEMSGRASALREMIDNMTHGGRIALLGLPTEDIAINWGKVVTHMLTLKGIYGREMYDTWYKMTFMLQTSEQLRDRVRSVITHRFPAEQWQDAFDAARSGEVGKVIMDWS